MSRETWVLAARHVPNTTCADEWYYACSGGNLVAIHVTNTTCMVERNPLLTCHSDRNEMEWRNLPELLVLSCVGFMSNVVDSSTPLTLRSE